MKATLKSAIKRAIDVSFTVARRTSVGRYIHGRVIDNAMSSTQRVTYNGLNFTFSTPNALNRFRVDTFATKEPETLEWIGRIPRGSTLWDIGANVGLYTCYAAKARDCQVFAFEPSVFNLELLARNIFLNGLVDQATIVPLPLSAGLAASKFNMTSTEWGGALSTFGHSYGHDGQPLHKVFEFRTFGFSMRDAVELLGIPAPHYIKIDVDGIEHLILQGGEIVLQRVAGVLIEINDDFAEQSEHCARYLQGAGLTLAEKRHSQMVEHSDFRSAYNQIWTRTV